MSEHDIDRLFRALGERTDLPNPSPAEVRAALDLARVVAHNFVRPGAPLACYAAGLLIGAATDPDDRAERLRALVAEVETMAAEDSAGG